MRRMPELVIARKVLKSKPCGILGYVTMAKTHVGSGGNFAMVSVSNDQKSTHVCVICVRGRNFTTSASN